MGQALLEQQQAEEMKERVKYYQIHQLALQKDTDARTQRAIEDRDPPPETQRAIGSGGASSSGFMRNAAGGLI